MTREEAIQVLKSTSVNLGRIGGKIAYVEALQMAIEALKAQDVTDTNVGDTVYRQAAIDALTEYGNGRTVYIGVEEAIRRIEQLPPAQPEIVKCKDCKYYREYGYVNGKPKFLPRCTFSSIYVNVDDFCSRAERRTDEQTKG